MSAILGSDTALCASLAFLQHCVGLLKAVRTVRHFLCVVVEP
jgi:hypothetical protein